MTSRALHLAFLLSMSLPLATHAQTIRGTVADDRDAPVAGVVVQLLDAQSAVVARALSNARGEYRLTAPTVGTYSIRTQRIGFRPTSFGPFTLRAGEDVQQRLALTGLPVTLTAIPIVSQSPCRALGNAGSTTYLVWEQVRAALSAAQVTAGMQELASTKLMYERLIDPQTDSLEEQKLRTQTSSMAEPWRSVTADSLHRAGYLGSERGGFIIYHAPNLDVLLSNVFIEDHCFRLAPSPNPERIGIAFEPIPGRRRIPEIRGTLWVDRRSSELRQMEFGYTNIPRERERYAAATSEFARMANGAWVISQWEVRMPLLERSATGPRVGRNGPRTLETYVGSIKIDGGQLLLVQRGDDTLWSRPQLVLTGSVTDSASRPVTNARVRVTGLPHSAFSDTTGRFALANVSPGTYTVQVRTASLDSMGVIYESRRDFMDDAVWLPLVIPSASQVAAQRCSSDPTLWATRETRGIIAGRVVMSGRRSGLRNAQVVAEWVEVPSGADVSSGSEGNTRALEARTDARGFFRICGVPVGVDLVVRAAGDGASSAPVRTMLKAGESYGYVSLTLDSGAGRGSGPPHTLNR